MTMQGRPTDELADMLFPVLLHPHVADLLAQILDPEQRRRLSWLVLQAIKEASESE